jgi:hypothetical protein
MHHIERVYKGSCSRPPLLACKVSLTPQSKRCTHVAISQEASEWATASRYKVARSA